MRLALAAVAALLAGCLEAPMTLDEATCPPGGTALRYDTFAQPYFAQYCDGCHTGARSGAPAAYRFDSRDGIRTHAARIFARAAGPNVSMPPGPVDPPEEGRAQLAEWLACGMP
ncbi:MAG: cytochrome c [Deltaproteobacteria bacterium]|nr:cytochrome c [Deltaproteobacteria bacterium]